MKIGILGGSFNPPHTGHLILSLQVKKILSLDEIWLMPCFQHPFHKNLAPVEHRLKMTKLLAQDNIKVSNYEINQNKQSYTIDTLRALTQKFCQHTFYWIMGSDQLQNIREYKDWQELTQKYNIIIFPREPMLPNIEKKVKEQLGSKTIPSNITVLKSKKLILTNASSSGIRQKIKNKQPITHLVPQKVIKYITKYHLYEK